MDINCFSTQVKTLSPALPYPCSLAASTSNLDDEQLNSHMVNKLFTQFQGTLIGSFIGAKLGNSRKYEPWWLMMPQKITARLLERGELSQDDWKMILPSESDKNKSLATGELILGILPLILFLFDTPYLLREQLQSLINLEQLSSQTREDLLLWSELLGQILSVKSLANSTDNQPWQQINLFLEQGTPLMEVKTYFKQKVTPEQFKMLLSVYCFRNNPEDFRLGVLRATQTGDSVITALTGALAGAYNGISGIPLHWRLGISDPDKRASMEEQVKQLWAKWAGVYSPEQVNREWQTHEITSPFMVQKFPSKRLVSQKNI